MLLASACTAAGALADDPALVIMPVELEINGRSAGEVVLRARPDLGQPAIQGSSFKPAVIDRLVREAAEAVLALPDDFVPLADVRAAGIELELDLERLVLVLSAPEKQRPKAAGGGTLSLAHGGNLRVDERQPEAAVSGYANLRLQGTLTARESGRDVARPQTAEMLHVVNVHGWALSANAVYSNIENTAGSRWAVGDLTLTHDVPSQAVRWTLGDLASPIGMLQKGSRLFGVSMGREFTLQPYRTYQPTGTAAFSLQEASTVDVYLNGARVRTLQLEAGRYTLEDFNLAAGANDLVLQITSASGLREEINITQFTARTLLRAGVSEFAVSAGFPAAEPGQETWALLDEPWVRKYYAREPLLSGFYRRGLSDTLTLEANLQGADYWQRFGLGADVATRMGALELHAAANRHRSAPHGFAAWLGWEHAIGPTSLRVTSAYTSRHYTQTESVLLSGPGLGWNHAVTAATRLPWGLENTTSAFYQTRHDAPASWGAVTRLARRFGSFVVSASLQTRRDRGRTDTGGFVTVSWNQPASWSVRATAGAGDPGVNPGSSAELTWSRRQGQRHVFGNVAARSAEDGDHYSGGIRYQDNTVAAELIHRQVYTGIFGQTQSRTETVGSLEIAMAYADGAWGVTRRVDGGFAVVTTHPRWRDVRLGIDPAFGGFEHVVRPPFRAAVLTPLPAYRESTSFIQTVDSDQVLENSDFYFFPSYRRGTRVIIGSDAIYTIRGTLAASSGETLAFRAISLRGPAGHVVTAFTNSAGRFVAGPLAEGVWRITCADTEEWTEVEVGGEATFIRLQPVRLRTRE